MDRVAERVRKSGGEWAPETSHVRWGYGVWVHVGYLLTKPLWQSPINNLWDSIISQLFAIAAHGGKLHKAHRLLPASSNWCEDETLSLTANFQISCIAADIWGTLIWERERERSSHHVMGLFELGWLWVWLITDLNPLATTFLRAVHISCEKFPHRHLPWSVEREDSSLWVEFLWG